MSHKESRLLCFLTRGMVQNGASRPPASLVQVSKRCVFIRCSNLLPKQIGFPQVFQPRSQVLVARTRQKDSSTPTLNLGRGQAGLANTLEKLNQALLRSNEDLLVGHNRLWHGPQQGLVACCGSQQGLVVAHYTALLWLTQGLSCLTPNPWPKWAKARTEGSILYR